MIKVIYFDFFNVISTFDNDRRLIEYIKTLKSKFKIGLISNSSIGGIERFLKEDISLFDIIVLACETDIIKPNKAFFELAIEKVGCSPDEILFFDDSVYNVESARAVGINASIYTNFENFLKDISAYVD